MRRCSFSESVRRLLLLLLLTFASISSHFHHTAEALLPCSGEVPDVCGFLPSTYGDLGLAGVPALCDAECTLEGGFDQCGVCGGEAEIARLLLEPLGVEVLTKLGGSVANWNGSVASSQHIAQELVPVVDAPVVTWTLDHSTMTYQYYALPRREADATDQEDRVPLGMGNALIMSEDYLVVGAHDSHPREVQLWTRTTSPPWSFAWSANDPCPGNRFGFSVAVDQRLPTDGDDDDGGLRGSVAAGDPGAFFSGRVYVYYSFSPGILQTLYYGSGNETELACYGYSVSADSGYLAVGAPALDYGGETNAGSVFLYQWNPAVGPLSHGLYEFRVQITPPTPEHNGGFGQAVAVYDQWLLIGDNQRNLYLYQLAGAVAVPLSITRPVGTNLISRLGYTLSIWDQYALAGDENYVVSPSAKGATFVYGRNPLNTALYRSFHRLSDEQLSFDTHYGAAVDVRGGCFAVSGATGQQTRGGVFVANLCTEQCRGCDGLLNSCVVYDECDVCDGDGQSCRDCAGVIDGLSLPDACGVCAGNNDTCVLAYALPASLSVTCADFETTELHHLFEAQHGKAVFTLAAPFPTKGTVVIDNSATPVTLQYDDHEWLTGADTINLDVLVTQTGATGTLSIPVLIGPCIDCLGVPDGPARLDECGICQGDNSTCAGCDGVPNSGLQLDYCLVCGGANDTCLEITTEPVHVVDCTSQIVFYLHHEPAAHPVHWQIIDGPQMGTAVVNLMSGAVIYHNPSTMGYDWFVVEVTSMLSLSLNATQNITFFIEDCVDCAGNQHGLQIVDACGVCGGNSQSCADCHGLPNGPAIPDVCSVCGGDGTSCLDCAGVPFGPATLDVCGVCDGNDDTCSLPSGVTMWIIYTILLLLMTGIAIYAFYWQLTTWRYARIFPKNQRTVKPGRHRSVFRYQQEGTVEAEVLVKGGSAQQNVDTLTRGQDFLVIDQPRFRAPLPPSQQTSIASKKRS